VVKPKQELWPITTGVNNKMNQSELEADTCHKRQTQENACEQVMISFGFTSDWSTKLRE